MGIAAERGEETPQRRCIASGEVRPRHELLRFVVGPDGVLVPDPAGELPGRGLWLRPRRDMIEKARCRRLFARAARAAVTVPEDLPEQVEHLLRRRCLDLVGLAARARQAVAGRVKVRVCLEHGGAALLLQARDGAADGRDKLRRLGRAIRPELPVIALFDSAELGQALGRAPTVHVAVGPGRLAARLEAECARLAALTGESNDGRSRPASPAQASAGAI